MTNASIEMVPTETIDRLIMIKGTILIVKWSPTAAENVRTQPLREKVPSHFVYEVGLYKWSRVVRKQAFCTCENKDADQLRGNREADQRLWFRYIDITIPLLPIYGISSLYTSCVAVQPGLYGT